MQVKKNEIYIIKVHILKRVEENCYDQTKWNMCRFLNENNVDSSLEFKDFNQKFILLIHIYFLNVKISRRIQYAIYILFFL